MTFSSVVVPPPQLPFQLLEINIISAQDLAPISKKMRTYAIAWIHPDRKLSTRVDSTNKNNPTWNDKFVFRVDDAFLRSDTSSVMIEIYDINSIFKDKMVGSINVLISNLIPPAARIHQTPGMRFVALQIRRPSGRPQGILNLGVALLDGSLRSMPLYTRNNGSAVGYRDLMGEKPNSPHHHHNLRRSRSERHSNVTDVDFQRKSGSDLGEPPLATITTTGSMWSESDVGPAPSSVAAQMLADEVLKSIKNNNNNSSSHSSNSNSNNVLDKWGAENTVEDLKTKLERWRTELPPVFDHRGGGPQGTQKTGTRHVRRHTEGGAGVFSCFGDLYGLQCSVSCGLKSSKNKKTCKGKGKGKTTFNSSDNDEISQSFI